MTYDAEAWQQAEKAAAERVSHPKYDPVAAGWAGLAVVTTVMVVTGSLKPEGGEWQIMPAIVAVVGFVAPWAFYRSKQNEFYREAEAIYRQRNANAANATEEEEGVS